MAVLKRKVDSKAKGFSPYAGEDPKPGVYRARLIQGSIRAKSTGRLAYNWLYELEASKPQHKKYDGYSGFCEILLGEEEWAQAQEGAFVKAITGKDNFQNVNVAFTGKEEDFSTSTGAPMTAFDGVKIANKIVNINLRMEKERTGDDGKEYPAELRARGILPWKKSAEEDEAEDAEEVDDEDFAEEGEEPETDEAEESDEDDDADEEGEEMTDEEWEQAKEARRTKLKSRAFGLDKLRETLKEQGVDTKGMKKEDLVEAILALEFAEDDEDAGDEEAEDLEATESDEAEEADDEEEDDEDEEEDDEEEADEEADLESEIRAEAADLDRAALKKAIKALDETAKFKTSQSDDDLREIFVELKVNAPGF